MNQTKKQLFQATFKINEDCLNPIMIEVTFNRDLEIRNIHSIELWINDGRFSTNIEKTLSAHMVQELCEQIDNDDMIAEIEAWDESEFIDQSKAA